MRFDEGPNNNGVLLGIAAVAGAAIVLPMLFSKSSYAMFKFSEFVDLEATQGIANRLSGLDEDNYVAQAWSIVADGIQYEPVASDIVFLDGTVKCRSCLMPNQVLAQKHPVGNFVAKSALLLSILRHKIPASRVYMVMGELRLNGVGGHAWVELEKSGSWYIIESTVSPSRTPLLSAESQQATYIPQVIVNDIDHRCLSGAICVSVDKSRICPCLQ